MSTLTEDDDGSAQTQSYSGSRVYRWLDDRLDMEDGFLGKAFPEDRYASFLLGEVTLFSFIILVITGTFLGLFYTPGAESVKYTGIAASFAGKSVPASFASVLRITYDIPMGMWIRQVHHWGAYLFITAMALHMLRVFFSGAYRNPRELNWIVGASLLFISLVEGYMGYALPFDNYGSTATGIGFEMAGSIPYIGKALKKIVFGGAWSDNANHILPRFFFYHVFLIPLLIAGLIGVHMMLLIRQKHTEQRGARDDEMDVSRDDESVVTGVPLVPNQAAVTLIVFLSVFGTLSLLAGFFPVQRIVLWGPNNPFSTPSGVAPDWYFMWVFGLLKIAPSFVPKWISGVLMPLLISGALISWPFIDYHDEQVHFDADPIERPMPTAVGVGAIVLEMLLSIDGMNATVANLLGPNVSTGTATNYLLYVSIIVPIVWALLTYYVLKRGVQRRQSSTQPSEDDSDVAAAVSDD